MWDTFAAAHSQGSGLKTESCKNITTCNKIKLRPQKTPVPVVWNHSSGVKFPTKCVAASTARSEVGTRGRYRTKKVKLCKSCKLC